MHRDSRELWQHAHMAGYSSTPLARKLGVGEGSSVLLDGSPAEFVLPELPDGVRVHRRAGTGPYDVIVCFCPSLARLSSRWPVLHPLTTAAGALWIAWPKRTSGGTGQRSTAGNTTDLNENAVRDFALANGRVDVKVCAIDDVWSGLKHVIRKADR
jgi:hypothetical protein